MMKNTFIVLLLLMVLAVTTATALPTTAAVTGITNEQVTFNANGGAAGAAWFEWGSRDGGSYPWRTWNETIGGGAYSDNQWGPPMRCGATYYVRACDTTGCDANDVSFTTSACAGMNATNFGSGMKVVKETGFNITATMGVLFKPWENQITAPVMWGLLFFFIFAGIWMRGKDITIPMFLAIISGGAIWLGTSALGVPPEFAAIGQGLMYAGIAGVVFAWFSK